jgi:hypothetical protein
MMQVNIVLGESHVKILGRNVSHNRETTLQVGRPIWAINGMKWDEQHGKHVFKIRCRKI